MSFKSARKFDVWKIEAHDGTIVECEIYLLRDRDGSMKFSCDVDGAGIRFRAEATDPNVLYRLIADRLETCDVLDWQRWIHVNFSYQTEGTAAESTGLLVDVRRFETSTVEGGPVYRWCGPTWPTKNRSRALLDGRPADTHFGTEEERRQVEGWAVTMLANEENELLVERLVGLIRMIGNRIESAMSSISYEAELEAFVSDSMWEDG